MKSNIAKSTFKLSKIGFTLRQSFILFIFLFFAIAVLQVMNIQKVRSEEKNVVVNDIRFKIEAANTYINNYLSSASNLLIALSTRKDLFELSDEDVKDVIDKIGKNSSNIASAIYVLRDDGKIFTNMQSVYDIVGNDTLDMQIKKKHQNRGIIRWTEPYYNNLTKNTVCLLLPLTEGERVIGVELNLTNLKDEISGLLKGREYTFIINSKNENVIVFDNELNMIPIEKETYPTKVKKEILDEIIEKKLCEFYNLESLPNRYLVHSDKNTINWDISVIFDNKVILERTKSQYLNAYFFTMLWIAGIAAILPLLSFSIATPLRNLALKMERIKNVDDLTEIKVEHRRNDEIARISNSYNSLIRQVHVLINDIKLADEKKKQYELKMLRSQIGPHFLYNTLACIASQARQERTKEVGETISCLVDLLSFSFDKTGEHVTLEQEILGLESYLKIQKMRYGDKFDIFIDIDEKVKKNEMLKLTLQPLVENAIFHGIIPNNRRGKIVIRAHNCGADVVVLVCDNGVGISKERCKKVLLGQSNQMINDRFCSIGMSNVNERIRLHYGDRYGLTIKSKIGIGTIIRIRVPNKNHEILSEDNN